MCLASCQPGEMCGAMSACFPDLQVLPALDAEGVDLLRRLLQYNPKERITAAEAVRHPWLADAALEVPEQAAAGMDAAEEDKASPFSDETQIRTVPDGEYNSRLSSASQGHPSCPSATGTCFLRCCTMYDLLARTSEATKDAPASL